MSVPFKKGVGWQTIYRRVVEWQRIIGMRDEVMMFSDDDHDPDLPFSRAEAELEVQKWWWQP